MTHIEDQGELVTSQPKSEKRSSWFDAGKSLEYILEYLQKAKEKIRIATGFFTIRGWNLVRHCTKGKQTHLLVGLDDPGEQRARIALIQEIMRDLRTGLDRDRRKAVRDLVNKMESNQLKPLIVRGRSSINKI